MAETADRRIVARITVPRHLTGPELELRLVRLLDLSPDGARIEHLEPLHEGVVCYVDLPPALGKGRLTGRVVWTRIHASEQTTKGERYSYYQSGLAFTNMTPEQQFALAHALAVLKTASNQDNGEAPH
jgi:hypothetical protein